MTKITNPEAVFAAFRAERGPVTQAWALLQSDRSLFDTVKIIRAMRPLARRTITAKGVDP